MPPFWRHYYEWISAENEKLDTLDDIAEHLTYRWTQHR